VFELAAQTETRLAFVAASAVVGTGAFAPYIRDVLRGRTVPCRTSWLVWSVLSTIAFASLAYEGATYSLVFVGLQAGGTIVVFGLSAAFGRGVRLRAIDLAALAAAGAGMVLWWATADGVWALGLSIAIGAIGGVMTALKAARQPRSETLATWLAFTASAVLALLSVRAPDPVLLAYPAYLATIYGMISAAVMFGRHHHRLPILRSGVQPHL
jgi:hypothetical protein